MSDMFPRTAGVLLHPTSLAGNFGVGDLGAPARAFVTWMSASGLGLWQTLPLVIPGPGESPYSSLAAMSGNSWMISLEDLVNEGLLEAHELNQLPKRDPQQFDLRVIHEIKVPALERAAGRLIAGRVPQLSEAMARFTKREAWVEDTALFLALRKRYQGQGWWEWPAPLRDRDPGALHAARQELQAEVATQIALQFLFDHQWQTLRNFAAERGVRIMGDLPIYVDLDSVDVWCQREAFELDEHGRPHEVAGVPPDYFSETGQRWGNPLYDWAQQARTGHDFWVRRLRRALSLFDVLRIDHFRAFASYWAIPAEAVDARSGRWREGPGTALFDDLKKVFGATLPFIAEDLGIIGDDVIELRETVDLPGMRVLQFAFGEDADHPFLPHNYPQNTVTYTGTHDNDTLLGFWHQAPERIHDHVRRYLGVNGHDIVWDLIRLALASVAHTAVIPMQDLLCLGSEDRMNTPGTALGNWRWRLPHNALNEGLAQRLRALITLYNR